MGRHKFKFETAQLRIITKTEVVTQKEIVTKVGFFGGKREVEVEKKITVDKSQVKITKISGEAEYITEDLGNGVKLEMVYIPAGSFMMGSNERDSEKPIHPVTIDPFCMGRYTITQQQYQAIMGENPSKFKGDNRPVETVSWNNAVKFCKKLFQLTGKQYTLPSESQWEYACRAGTTTPFCFGETITPDLANYDGNHTYGKAPKGQYRKQFTSIVAHRLMHTHYSWYGKAPKSQYREQTTDVGSFPPNAFGLYDMHGNVWEWCLDTWHNNYAGAPTDGSAWLDDKNQTRRLLRGGSWSYDPRVCRAATRFNLAPDIRNAKFGFRVVCEIPRTL